MLLVTPVEIEGIKFTRTNVPMVIRNNVICDNKKYYFGTIVVLKEDADKGWEIRLIVNDGQLYVKYVHPDDGMLEPPNNILNDESIAFLDYEAIVKQYVNYKKTYELRKQIRSNMNFMTTDTVV